MALKLISSKVGEIKINEVDPAVLPELHTFHSWSLASASAGVSYGESQHPFGIVHGCGQINTSDVFSLKSQGKIFEVLAPGEHVTDTSLASDWYPTHLPDPKPELLLAMVHSCTRAAVCRELLDTESSFPLDKIKERETEGASWLNTQGLRRISLKTENPLPESDSLHAHSRAFRILTRSDEIRAVVAAGNLLVLEAYYDNKTGRISWPGFWTSSENGISRQDLEAVLNWQLPVSNSQATSQLETIRNVIKGRKALENVLTLVIGNSQHVLSRIQGEKKIFKADYVILGCSDSRAGPQMLYSPEGRIEWIRTAGHAIDRTTMHGLRIACESAVKNIKDGMSGDERLLSAQHKRQRRAVLYILGHTQCGAVNATLKSLAEKEQAINNLASPASPLVYALKDRFLKHDFLRLLQEPQQIKAAEINAIQTVKDILKSANPDARRIQKLVTDCKLLVVPAVYYTSTGIINQLIDSEIFKQQLAGDYQEAV